MSMLLPDAAELRRLHYEHEHQCCWLFDGETQCGLWCGHDSDHTPHQVGAYLPPPVIGPLALLALHQNRWSHFACLLCRTRVSYVSCDTLFRAQWDGDRFAPWGEPEDGPSEYLWRFEPCGCEGREILPEGTP